MRDDVCTAENLIYQGLSEDVRYMITGLPKWNY